MGGPSGGAVSCVGGGVIVEVDTGSPTPPYEQIRAQVARMIETGVLPAEARLPPIRQLAADLGVAANTVARAYRELEAEGLVVSRVRHGTTVTPPAAPGVRRLPADEVDRRLTEAARAYVALARQLGVTATQAESAVRHHLRPANP
jgi:GntR family transcriptional regulator